MGFSRLQEEFVTAPAGYPRAVPIARIDAYWTTRGPQFLEINTDGTAYIDYSDRLNSHYLEVMGPFLGSHARRFESLSVRQALLDTLLESYRQFCATSGRRPKSNPLVAIMDYREVKTRQDQTNIAVYLVDRGLPSMTVDPRELNFRAGRLYRGKTPIDIIYRRATSREIFTRPHDFRSFLAAYRSKAICVVGSFHSDPGFHKASLQWALDSLPPKERIRLEPHIPRILIGPPADRAIRQQNDYLYKPADRNQGKGIRLGAHLNRASWLGLVAKARRGEGALQKLVLPPPFRAPRELGLAKYGDLRLNLGIFVIGGRFAGVCARLTPDLILGERSPEWLIPVYCEVKSL
ncbi:MAG: hypothetical protein HYT87_10275 [Nitrospirae bacterium]|nr:hypothetical protein [Nitrospirota bacterium]